eukprot:GHVN01031851.1.p1 GENE.GHVN01031851.1~~GHVN01031851.1.p1  ORF type:complete len:482 (+),score=99.10 GHVN01031851.1:1926-3371(+)
MLDTVPPPAALTPSYPSDQAVGSCISPLSPNEPQPSPPSEVSPPPPPNTKHVDERYVVVDTGAFIRTQRVDQLGDNVIVCVTPGVLGEIRDPRAREHARLLLKEPRVMTPSPNDLKWARYFAKLTGDVGFLSEVDLEVIALTYMLHRMHGDKTTLRNEPMAVGVRKGSPGLGDGWGVGPVAGGCNNEEASSGESEGLDDDDDVNGVTEGGEAVGKGFTKHENVSASNSSVPVGEEIESTPINKINNLVQIEEGDGDELSDDEDAGEWITKETFNRVGLGVETTQALPVSGISTDFSIQNVMIQMGLNIITVDGYRVRRVRLWGLYCRACFTLERDTTALFCRKCASARIDRVPITVDADGEVTIHDNRKRINLKKINKHVPKMKQGRNENVMITSEDMMLMGGRDRQHRHMVKQWNKQRAANDPFNEDSTMAVNGAWSRRVYSSGKVAMPGAPRINVAYRSHRNGMSRNGQNAATGRQKRK